MRCIALVAVGLLVPVLSLGACGGGDASKEAPRGLQLTVHESTAARFRASVAFGPPALTAREEAGEIFTLVDLEGCRPGGANDGEPGVPVLTRILAVPQGARLVVSDVKPVVSERRLLLLYPYQVLEGEYSPAFEQPGPIPLEEEDWAPPFAYDRAAYAGSTLYPSDPVEVSIPSVARDLSVAVLQIAAGQYDPGRRLLTLFSSVEFTITFEGGTGLFLRDAAGNPFEEGSRTAVASTWNRSAKSGGRSAGPSMTFRGTM